MVQFKESFAAKIETPTALAEKAFKDALEARPADSRYESLILVS